MAHIYNLQSMVLDALEVVHFKLIRSRNDVENHEDTFHPMMAHQIFGEKESIFGYRDLKIYLMYAAASMHLYINIKYNHKVEDIYKEGVKADDVFSTITSKLPNGSYHKNLDDFLKIIDKEGEFKPFGEKLDEHFITEDSINAPDKRRHFEIYHCKVMTPKFRTFFSRLQTFILWFVDAASYIDLDDLQWTYFMCYEKYKNENGRVQYATVGYSTVYRYYAYPEHMRPRISQLLILPPFQKMGIAAKLVETVYRNFASDPKVIDITVEDPSEDFQRVRNYVDAKLCRDLPAFSKDIIKNGFSNEMINEAKEKWKINPKQCRRVYEILRLYHMNRNDTEEYRKYRLEIKKRLNLIYHKQLSDIEKLRKANVDVVFMTSQLPTKEERIDQLKDEYEEIELEYEKVINRLK